MALSQTDLLSVVGVVLLLVGVMGYNTLRAAKSRSAGRRPDGAPAAADRIVGRYVRHAGAIVGQAIAVQDGRVLVRQGSVHKAVPQSRLETAGDDLRLAGDLDWAAAEREGQAWAEARAAAPPAAPAAGHPGDPPRDGPA